MVSSNGAANQPPFARIAIVNRGESAMRLIHAVRDLNAQTGTTDSPGAVRTIALYTDAEPAAMFVREADVAHSLGPASARPYLNYDLLEEALLVTGADAVWVGWGFVAEDPNFAELCARLGITFIGPSPDAMRKLGDKVGSKLIAEEVGVPVAPWSRGSVDTLEAAVESAGQIGYPLMLKATAGGGGRGIRVIHDEAELREAYQRTRDEAARAFGNDVVFLERLVTGARHVEVQVIADSHGTAWALGVRDCSVQRRNQKVIEESASPLLTPAQTDELKASAERLATAVGYCGAGTVEFLYHPGEKSFAFLEVNTRLQVEHPITEITTDTDLVRLQLHVAAGGRLEGAKPEEVGHAVEARLNAEDADRDFAPSPGRIELLELPSGPGIRVDTGVSEGDTIPADFDSMIAKIIATGRTRDEALARLRRAVSETAVVIEGGATNKSFLLDLLDAARGDRRQRRHRLDRPRARARAAWSPTRHSGVALVAAGIEAYEDDEQVELSRLLETARGGRPQVQHSVARPVDLKLRGRTYKVAVSRIGVQRFRVTVTNNDARHVVDATVQRLGTHRARLVVSGRPLPRDHRDARAGALRRGRRRRAPGQPRRGWRAALARPGTRRRDTRGGRHRGGCRRAGHRARVDEDGDAHQRAVRGDRARPARVDRQPGRDRRPADPARAQGRRRRDERRRRRRPRPARAGRRPGRHPVGPHRGAARLRRRPERRRGHARALPHRARHQGRTRRGRAARRDRTAPRVRRLRRAQPQPPGRRGRAHRTAGAQPARVLPQLPADPRPRTQRAAGPVQHQAAQRPRALRRRPTSSARRSSRVRSSGCSSPSSVRRRISRS